MSLNRICFNLIPYPYPPSPTTTKKSTQKSQKLSGKSLGWGDFFLGVCSSGNFIWGDFFQGGSFPGGIFLRGFFPGGLFPGEFLPETISINFFLIDAFQKSFIVL